MVSYLYRSTKNNDFVEIDGFKAGCWVYVEKPTEEELQLLADAHKLDAGILFDVLDEDEMPRLERDGHTNYLFTRFVHEHDDLQESTEVVLLVIRDDFIMTVSVEPFPEIDAILYESPDIYTTQRTKLFIQLLNIIIDGYDRQLTRVGRHVKGIRNRLKQEEINNQDFIHFVTLEDELNEFLTVLTPTTAILRRLLVGKHVKLYDEDEDIVEDLMLNTQQSIEESRAILRTITNIREAYSTITTNNLNRIIRILTVLTTILAVPTLIASIYGMNVLLPFGDNDNAFALVVGGSLTVSIILLIFFKWRRWL